MIPRPLQIKRNIRSTILPPLFVLFISNIFIYKYKKFNLKSYNFFKMSGDNIDQLPTDDHVPNNNEVQLVNNIFKNHSNSMSTVANEISQAAIIGALFVILSLPPVDKLLCKVFPICSKSFIILLVIKFIIFIIVYYFVSNFAFSKK
jgi:hypothetical protein